MASEIIDLEDNVITAASEKFIALMRTVAEGVINGRKKAFEKEQAAQILMYLQAYTAHSDKEELTTDERETILYRLQELAEDEDITTVVPVVGRGITRLIEQVLSEGIIVQNSGSDLTERLRLDFRYSLTASDDGSIIHANLVNDVASPGVSKYYGTDPAGARGWYDFPAVANVDSWKDPARVATTANITLSGEQTIDGVAAVTGDRVLVKNQTNQTQNGLYVCDAGAWTRTTDMDISSECNGAAVGVLEGTSNKNTVWLQTTDSVNLGVSNIVWEQQGILVSPAGATNEMQKNGGGGVFAGTKIFSSSDGDLTLGDSATGNTVRSIIVVGSQSNIGIYHQTKGTGFADFEDVAGNRYLRMSAVQFTAAITGTPNIESKSALTNTVQTVLKLTHTTSDVAAAGIGASLDFEVETANLNNEIGAGIRAVTTNVTPGSENFDIVFNNMAAGAAYTEAFRLTSAGDITWGAGKSAAVRNMTAGGSATNISMQFISKGIGGVALTSGDLNILVSADGDSGSSDARLRVEATAASTNTVHNVLRLRRASSGSPAAGIGLGIELITETAAGNYETGTLLESVSTDVTGASEDFDFLIKTMAGGATAAERIRIKSTGELGVGTSAPDRRFHVEVDDGTTNAVTYTGRFTHTTSGTPANGIGVGIEGEVETSAGNNEIIGTIEFVVTDVTGGSEDADMVFKTMTAGAAASEKFRIKSLGQVNFASVTADPGTLANGDFWYNSTDNKLRAYIDGATVDLGGGGISGLTTNRIPYATSATTLGDDSALTWDAANNALTIGSMRFHNSGASTNVFIGTSAGNFTLTQGGNIGIGESTMTAITSGSNNITIGTNAGDAITTGFGNIGIGHNAVGAVIGASDNIGIGRSALILVTSGAQNIGIGQQAGDNITTGSGNVVIGNDVEAPSPTASNQLSIQNIIFGTSNSGTGTTVSTGSIGIGTPSPDRKFHVEHESAATNTVTYMQRLTSLSSGVPANGIGVGIEFEVETSAGNNEIGATIEAVTTDVTGASEDFDIVLKNMAAGASATEALKISSLANITIGAGKSGSTRTITISGSAADVGLAISTKNNGDFSVTTGFGSITQTGTNGNIGIIAGATGQTGSRALHVVHYDNTSLTATKYPLRLETDGTAAGMSAGVGVGIEFECRTDAANSEIGATIEAITTDITGGSEDFDLVFKLMAAGAAVAERFRITSNGVVGILNAASAPGAALTNGVYIYSQDSGDATSTLALYTEQAAEATGTFTQTHRLKIRHNGTEYWLSLDAV